MTHLYTSPPPRTARAAVPSPLRHLCLRIHFFAGLLVGPFLLIAAISGALYAIAPTLEKVVYHDQLTATSAAQNVSIGEQVDTAQARHPDLPVSGIEPGSGGATTRVLFADPGLGSSSKQHVVFVDPDTGQVRGDTIQYGSAQALPLRTWISELHRNLHLGEPGRLYAELAASWLAPIALFGLFLWWQRRRRETGSAVGMLRDRTDRNGLPRTGRARQRSRHAVLGTWMLLGFFMIAATGLTWSAYAGDNIATVRTALNWTTPSVSAVAPEHAEHAGHSVSATAPMPAAQQIDAANQIALASGLTAPITLNPPTTAGGLWTAKESRRSWIAGPDAVSIDAAQGRVVESLPYADFPLAAKLTDWGIRLHMGFLFGLANQLLLAAIAVALAVITVRGYIMWWMRRPRGSAWGRPPRRGALRAVVLQHPLLTVLGVAVVAAIGWAVPLLGISLVAFLVIDVALGVWGRRRQQEKGMTGRNGARPQATRRVGAHTAAR